MVSIKQSLAVLALLCGIASLPAFANVIEDGINARLQPAGSVCIEGSDCAAATAAVSTASAGPRSGEQVYNGACTACHSTGAAGAPKLGDAAAWAARVSKGVDTLHANAINGFNAMPAKGLCMDCSDDEVIAAVDYIIDHSK